MALQSWGKMPCSRLLLAKETAARLLQRADQTYKLHGSSSATSSGGQSGFKLGSGCREGLKVFSSKAICPTPPLLTANLKPETQNLETPNAIKRMPSHDNAPTANLAFQLEG